jgi:hypothetical protein
MKKHFIAVGHYGNPRLHLDEDNTQENRFENPFIPNLETGEVRFDKHSFHSSPVYDLENPQIQKFLKKYPDYQKKLNYDELFIGSKK